VADAFKDTPEPEEESSKKGKDKKNIRTIVQDSPISKALSTILEYAAKNNPEKELYFLQQFYVQSWTLVLHI
jgi:hypothetical protein